jgi:hypothetical protein
MRVADLSPELSSLLCRGRLDDMPSLAMQEMPIGSASPGDS